MNLKRRQNSNSDHSKSTQLQILVCMSTTLTWFQSEICSSDFWTNLTRSIVMKQLSSLKLRTFFLLTKLSCPRLQICNLSDLNPESANDQGVEIGLSKFHATLKKPNIVLKLKRLKAAPHSRKIRLSSLSTLFEKVTPDHATMIVTFWTFVQSGKHK